MFTGLIEEIGKITQVSKQTNSIRLSIQCPSIIHDVHEGDSIAVDGCCLTAEEIAGNVFIAYASPETMDKTSLGQRSVGDEVNLERALAVGSRMGGHMVSGHVDQTGFFHSVKKHDESWEIRIKAPKEITSRSIPKGSIAIDGISLTIVDLTEDELSCWIIPETWVHTTLSKKKPGDQVNLESDMVGKYVYKFMENLTGGGKASDERILSLLQKGGWSDR